MRPIKTTLATAAVSAFLLASGPLCAAPTVSGWDLAPNGAGGQMVRIHWSEPAPIEITSFPASRQVMLTIPGAALSSGSLTAPDLDASALVSQIRFQPVTMANGADAVNVTLTLASWQELEAVAGARWLTLRPAEAATPDAGENPIRIAREKMDEPVTLPSVQLASYGSVSAPASGAGQAAEAPAFYIPPTVEDPALRAPDADIGMLGTLTTLDRRIDLTDFQGAPLEDVIRSIAKQLNLNIIMDPGTLPGTVTMELYNVKLSEALDALLKTKGKGYVVERGGIIRIVDRRQISDDPDITIVVAAVPVNWIDSKDLETILRPFTGGAGAGAGGGRGRGISVSEHSNTLIIRDTPEKVAEMQDLIRQLDIPEKQVMMEVRLVDMTESAIRNLNIQNNVTLNEGLAEGRYDTFRSMGAGGGINQAYTLTRTITDPTTGLPVTETGEFEFENIPGFSLLNSGSFKIFGRNYQMFNTIRAFEERNEAVTLAAPTILSLNNTAANISITRQIPYQQAQNTDQGSVATISFVDIGTTVQIIPRITNNGFVTMRVTPSQSILISGGSDLSAPTIDKRAALSTVTVQDEETVVFGGLRQFNSGSTDRGVPWLLRVPVFSWIFKESGRQQNKLEMVMFVRPSIVKDPAPSAYEQAVFDKLNYNWDLPDYYFDEVTPRDAPGEHPDPFIKR